MSNVTSLTEYRRLRNMTPEQRIKELTEYYDDLLEKYEDRIALLELKVQELEMKV